MFRSSAVAFSILAIGLVACVEEDAVVEPEVDTQQRAQSYSRVIVEYAPGNKSNALGAARGHNGTVNVELDAYNAFAVTLPTAALNGLSGRTGSSPRRFMLPTET